MLTVVNVIISSSKLQCRPTQQTGDIEPMLEITHVAWSESTENYRKCLVNVGPPSLTLAQQ